MTRSSICLRLRTTGVVVFRAVVGTAWTLALSAGQIARERYNGATMNQAAREKIALVVFMALVVFAVAGSIWYMNVGHTWNVAANKIDDAAGSLDGYIALVYDGVAVPTVQEADSDKSPVTRHSVAKSYTEKKAATFSLNTVDKYAYREGVILKNKDKRIGVFSVYDKATANMTNQTLEYFNSCNVDMVVCIVTDSTLLQGKTTGIDVVIATHNEKKSPLGSTTNGTYSTNAPSTGKIGAILISPRNVVSSKDIDSL